MVSVLYPCLFLEKEQEVTAAMNEIVKIQSEKKSLLRQLQYNKRSEGQLDDVERKLAETIALLVSDTFKGRGTTL